MDDVKLRKRKKATQFTPSPAPSLAPTRKRKYNTTTKNTRVTRTGEKLLTASGSAPRSSKREKTVYKKDNDDYRNEVVGGWLGSSTRPKAVKKVGKNVGGNIAVKKRDKTTTTTKTTSGAPKKSVEKQGQTWVSGFGPNRVEYAWDGGKKLTIRTFVEGGVLKEKVKEFWSVARAREKFWRGWVEREGPPDTQTARVVV
ncbi:hypothetical protein TrRE_jg3595 [Triparma retinervis]|uniref:Uncharacterized protein n=1 Tax=Triparma retinervis TaxID=2557542 RepID=A0A9W7L7W1_9STRA|nr:hypothetical protein TrRE_jg3595 [Triparma retinervis]